MSKLNLRQFGLRTLLLLVALAAVGAWLARNEVVREERREKLIADLDSKGAAWILFQAAGVPGVSPPPPLWRQSIGAWLRGKTTVLPRARAVFPKGTTAEQFREFVDLFPDVRWVQIEGSDATVEVLDLFALRGPYHLFMIVGPVAVDEVFARKLARIKTVNGVRLAAQEGTDAALKNLVDAGVIVEHYACRNRWRQVSDEGFKAAARLQKNNIMWLNCRGSDEGLRAFVAHPSLMNLYISGPGYTDASADVFPSLPKLAYLRLSVTSHTDAGLAKALEGCNANFIDLHKVAVGDQTIAALAKVPNLGGLSLDAIDLAAQQWDAVALLPLFDLRLKGDNLTDDQVSRLAPLAGRLNSFTLDAPKVTDAGLTWLSGATKVTELRLENTQATAATWSLVPLPGPARVGLGGPNVDAQTLAAVSKRTIVTELVLRGNAIDDSTLASIPRPFATIALLDTRVSAKGLRQLANTAGVSRIEVIASKSVQTLITEGDAAVAQWLSSGASVTFQEAVSFECE